MPYRFIGISLIANAHVHTYICTLHITLYSKATHYLCQGAQGNKMIFEVTME